MRAKDYAKTTGRKRAMKRAEATLPYCNMELPNWEAFTEKAVKPI